VQDDFLDCYGAPEVIGKIGTDILDNKCSWNVNTALAVATPEQRRVLDEHYGRKNAESEAKVKEIYKQEPINIARRYEEYEADIYKKLTGLIATVDEQNSGMKKEVFESFLGKIYKRTK
jgi:farnesyl diphosphate synthase